MKNIFLLPTDKPSRLIHNDSNQLCYQSNKSFKNDRKNRKKFNIYITSDEEITGFENNIWVIKGERIFLWQNTMALVSNNKPRKIILTTDQDLIKDGVQAIDDEFLEWFVKNPSCESVDIGTSLLDGKDDYGYYGKYKIIIPKEEPKQETLEEKLDKIVSKEPSKFWAESDDRFKNKETLEETAERWNEKQTTLEFGKPHNAPNRIKSFIEGAKWQQEQDKDFYFKYIKSEMDFQKPRIAKLGISTTDQIFEQQVTSLIHLAERSCSEEEMKRAFCNGGQLDYSALTSTEFGTKLLNKWFEQFKKK